MSDHHHVREMEQLRQAMTPCWKCGGDGCIETWYEDYPYPIVTRCTYCENEDPESSTFEELDDEEETP